MTDLNLPNVDTGATSNIAAVPEKNFFTSYLEDLKTQTFDYDEARIKLKSLVDQWKLEVEETDERRRTRDIDVDVMKLRNEGSIDEDETLIPDRVIDANITREQPPYINYLKNSRRLAIFTCLSNPDINSQKLELEYTRGRTYIGWEKDYFKCLDGAQTHGWDAVEVVYDEDKPLHVAVEQLGHDKLYFPKSCLDIQTAPSLIRVYDVSVTTLKKFVEEFGFSEEQTGIIISAIKDGQKEPETVKIYKRLNRYNGQAYVSWFCLEYGCSDWLKVPTPLFLGIRNQDQTGNWKDTPIKQYPIFLQYYRETEKPKIMDHKGRVFYDENKQEAQTAVLSAFVNGLTRASNVYCAYGQDDGTGSSLQEIEGVALVGSRIWNKPLQFFSPPYPDPMVLKAMQYFDVANDVEMNQPNFAAMNRQDSRKTAKEITSSEQQQSLLNSVQLTLFSTHIRAIENLCWLIVQSQALQNAIKFCQIQKQKPVPNPITGQPIVDPNTGQPQMQSYWENDIETISQVYDIRAAGDVDVIQKNEKVMQMKQDWPVIANTPLANTFLAELLRLEYADTGEKWASTLEQSGGQIQQMQGMVNHLAQIIMSIFKDKPELMQTLAPQEQQGIKQVLQQAQQMSGPAQTQPQ